MNLGIIARADKTGLGNQTRNLVKMLQPFRVMVIDSTPFNQNEQFFSTYAGYKTQRVKGFPTTVDIVRFIRGLDAVLTCELFYNSNFVNIANMHGVRTYNQFNYEFLDNLANPRLQLPTKLLAPSKWYLEEMQALYPGRVEYLPPPTIASQYYDVKEYNLSLDNKPRFLHTVGRWAVNDRNGTLDLIKALEYTKEDFEIVFKVQAGANLEVSDKRVVLDYSSPTDEVELYKGFHALILPRRYAGLCLPMNEGLMSGLPVVMTDIEPNNLVLPKEWLVESTHQGKFNTRTEIDLYSALPQSLAKKIDELCSQVRTGSITEAQNRAAQLGFDNYSVEALLPKYREIIL